MQCFFRSHRLNTATGRFDLVLTTAGGQQGLNRLKGTENEALCHTLSVRSSTRINASDEASGSPFVRRSMSAKRLDWTGTTGANRNETSQDVATDSLGLQDRMSLRPTRNPTR